MNSRENHLAGIVRRLAGAGRKSEEQARAAAESLSKRLSSFPLHNPNPVVETDLDGNVTYMNPAAQELLEPGTPRGSHPLASQMGPFRARLQSEAAGVLTREITVQGSTYEQKFLYIPEDFVIRIYSTDVTRMRAAHAAMIAAGEEAQRLAAENETLGEIGRIVSSSLDINDVYAGFGEQLRSLIQFDRLSISLVNMDENTFTNAYTIGDKIPGRNPGEVIFLEGTVTNEAVRSRTSMVVQGDPAEMERRYPNLIRYPSVVLAPLIYRGELFGVLNARSLKMNVYEEKDAEMLSRVAAQITPAIANSLLYADIVRAQDDLARSNSELEQFAYAASHDLQEPLRTITAYLGLVKERYAAELDETAVEFMDFAIDGAERMQQLISDLLEYSKVGTEGRDLEPVNCSRIMDGVLNSLNEAIKSQKASVECSPLPIINGDEAQLARLFQNLVGNALKFTGEAVPRIQIWAELQGGDWVFSVKDNGIGIAPDYQERIFGMFARLHSRTKYSGTGIGLALCSKIAQRHGGRIWVESEIGHGATFRFNIPVTS
jgi:signal transduction histidine kinase/PAS domain-containing protein